MDKARAAEPFFSTIGKGTGLGLSMVYGFAAQSGGSLLLESVPSRGTTAKITLPARERRDEAPSVVQMTNETANSSAERGLSILAVDDDALVLMNTGDLLEDLGHNVVLAHSGKEALERLAEFNFDLIVTDHAMPRMTGAQLIAEVRTRQPDMPILIATGYADLPAGSELVDVPRLPKPFSQLQLKRAVDGLISTRRLTTGISNERRKALAQLVQYSSLALRHHFCRALVALNRHYAAEDRPVACRASGLAVRGEASDGLAWAAGSAVPDGLEPATASHRAESMPRASSLRATARDDEPDRRISS
jgi:CheY-like chemotaxis protein